MIKQKKIKIGINGFGRIGRTIFRVALLRDYFDVVAINDLNDSLESLAYLIKYDTIHGTLGQEVTVEDNSIICKNMKIKVFHEEKIERVPWNELGVQIVVGCTGNLENVTNAKRCIGQVTKKVLFTDSPEAVDHTFVFGVTHADYDPEKHDVIAASICDVVGFAPPLKKLNEKFGVKSGFLTTLHPWLFYQNILDGRSKSSAFSDNPWTPLALGRSSVGVLIPKNTSLVPALCRVLPELKNKLEGMSYRVPTEVVSSGIHTIVLESDTTTEEVRQFLIDNQQKPYYAYTEEPLVSVDYKHIDDSCVVDGKWIEVMDKRQLRIITWYDNEWGYSSRVIDIIKYVGDKL